jgi:hypothetical protein
MEFHSYFNNQIALCCHVHLFTLHSVDNTHLKMQPHTILEGSGFVAVDLEPDLSPEQPR